MHALHEADTSWSMSIERIFSSCLATYFSLAVILCHSCIYAYTCHKGLSIAMVK